MIVGLIRSFRRHRPWCLRGLILVFCIYPVLSITGLAQHLWAIPFDKFAWPEHSEVELKALVSGSNSSSISEISDALKLNGIRYSDGIALPHCVGRSDNGQKLLRILVKSTASNTENRAAIRETWGKLKNHGKWSIDLKFVIGRVKAMYKIKWESEKYNDLIVGGFQEGYRNNTRKFATSLLYSASCNDSDFLLLIDDDYMLNLPLLTQKMENWRSTEHFYRGYLFDTSPFRFVLHKHAVSLADYPYSRYPPYISAGAVFLSSHTVSTMLRAIPHVKLYNFDDVYAGILAYLLHIPVTHDPSFEFWQRDIQNEEWDRVICAHGFRPKRLRRTFTSVPDLQKQTLNRT